jgi:hypothetical protein
MIDFVSLNKSNCFFISIFFKGEEDDENSRKRTEICFVYEDQNQANLNRQQQNEKKTLKLMQKEDKFERAFEPTENLMIPQGMPIVRL